MACFWREGEKEREEEGERGIGVERERGGKGGMERDIGEGSGEEGVEDEGEE